MYYSFVWFPDLSSAVAIDKCILLCLHANPWVAVTDGMRIPNIFLLLLSYVMLSCYTDILKGAILLWA